MNGVDIGHQNRRAARRISDTVCTLLNRRGNVADGIHRLLHDLLQVARLLLKMIHRGIHIRRIIPVLYTVFYKSVIIRHDRPVDVFDDRVGIVGELIHCLRYQRVDGLNIVRGLSGGIRQLSYLIRDNCKSFSGFACSRRLNGSIQCQQICLGCNFVDCCDNLFYLLDTV